MAEEARPAADRSLTYAGAPPYRVLSADPQALGFGTLALARARALALARARALARTLTLTQS